nr:hypothetical protein [Tanacetum cinerariifolium]
MAEPVLEEYIIVTRKNYISRNNGRKIVEKKVKGTIRIKIHNNALSGTNGEDTIEHIENFLKVVDLLKIPNRMESNKEVTNDNEPCRDKREDSGEENEITEIFRIET